MAAWEYFTSNKQWEKYIKDLLKNDDKALLRAIVIIYNNQTEEEKRKRLSISENKIGFSKIDVEVMSKIANKIKGGNLLTEGELEMSRNKMTKYWKQLMVYSKNKAELKNMKVQKEVKPIEDERLQYFREDIAAIELCSEKGIQCEYGICDECPITVGLQIKMNI